jgi:hypothetical protein
MDHRLSLAVGYEDLSDHDALRTDILRADSGFCRWRMMWWCDRLGVDYLVGSARNAVIERQGRALMDEARGRYEVTDEKQRLFGEFSYAADTWDRERRVIAAEDRRPDRAVCAAGGAAPGQPVPAVGVVPNRSGPPVSLFLGPLPLICSNALTSPLFQLTQSATDLLAIGRTVVTVPQPAVRTNLGLGMPTSRQIPGVSPKREGSLS